MVPTLWEMAVESSEWGCWACLAVSGEGYWVVAAGLWDRDPLSPSWAAGISEAGDWVGGSGRLREACLPPATVI